MLQGTNLFLQAVYISILLGLVLLCARVVAEYKIRMLEIITDSSSESMRDTVESSESSDEVPSSDASVYIIPVQCPTCKNDIRLESIDFRDSLTFSCPDCSALIAVRYYER